MMPIATHSIAPEEKLCPLTAAMYTCNEIWCVGGKCAWWNNKREACSIAVLTDIVVDAYEQVCENNA